MASSAATTLDPTFQSALVALGQVKQSTSLPAAAGKALELWLLFKVAERLKASGWHVLLQDGAGQPLNAAAPFISRSQPGVISAANPAKPGYILVVQRGALHLPEAFELHGSLQFTGRSNADHEIDISALPHPVGRAIRAGGGGTPRGVPPVAIEVKHQISDGSIGEAREKLARMFDLTWVRRCPPRNGWQVFWHAVTSVGWGRRYHWYKHRFEDGVFGIARSSGFQSGARRLLRHYALHEFPDITSKPNLAVLLAAIENELS